MINALQDYGSIVRTRAANELGSIEGNKKAAISALRQTLKDEDSYVCEATTKALKQISNINVASK